MASGFNLLDQIEQSLSPKDIGIIEFATSSDYCNKQTLYPGQEVLLKLYFLEELKGYEEDILTYWINGGRNGTEITLSPNIRERTEWLRSHGYKHFREIVLPGGRRSSKGFTTGIAMAKIMWDTLALGDPGAYYGIDPEKEIFFSCVAGSEQQAKEFQYADLSSTIETCKSFEPYIVKSLETEIRVATDADLRKAAAARGAGNKVQKDIARLRGKALAANAGTLRGSATMALTVDEMAHMIPGESKAAADQVYAAAEPSLEQFGLDGIMFLNSSPYSKVGMFYERYMDALIGFDPSRPMDTVLHGEAAEDMDRDDLNGDPRLMAFQFPSWALYEGYQKSPRRKYIKHVIVASPDWDPEEKDDNDEFIWNETDRQRIMQARAKEAQNPETYKVERRGKFAEVTDAFLLPHMVDRMFQGVPDEIIWNGNQATYKLKPIPTNRGEDAINLHQYKFHLDPSSTTAGFGFAIAHTEMFDTHDGRKEMHVIFDLVKRWQAKDFGKVIDWKAVRQEVMAYAEIFRPFEITLDQHQSVEPIQLMTEECQARGINTRIYEKAATNELNWKRWEVFKTALYGGLVHAPYDTDDLAYVANELKFLQEIKTGGKFPRVDRQEIGPVQTKDMADCICECTFSLIGNLMVNRARDRLSNSSLIGGAPGGYGIGFSGLPQGGPGPQGISDFYSRREEKEAQAYRNPARGALGRGPGGRRGGNKARW